MVGEFLTQIQVARPDAAVKRLSALVRWAALLASVLAPCGAPVVARAADASSAPHIFLIGDSTMTDQKLDKGDGMRGWGQLLPEFFADPRKFTNHAISGRSTKSFINEGRWAIVIGQIAPGDFLIVQFGHNDEKQDQPTLHTEPRGAYQENLRRFIRESRAKGGHPILATPVARRRWSDANELVNTHGDYPAAMREVAKEEKVPLLELTTATEAMIRRHGVEESKRLFTWIAPDTIPQFPKGLRDDTHFSEYGARAVAAIAVAEMRRLNLPLMAWLKPVKAR